MVLAIFLIIIGFLLLIKGADFLVNGASSLARKLGISTLVIGLTVVAFGTSAPELIVNIISSIKGNTEIAIGNILGSNISNILLILGISAIIFPLAVKKSTVWKEIPLSLLAVVAIGLMTNDRLIDAPAKLALNENLFSGLTRIDGLILILFFIIFIYYSFGISKIGAADKIEIRPRIFSFPKSLLMILAGLAGLSLGGKWVVEGAVSLAQGLGVSQALIGLTIVAVGTSLPELFTSAVAAYKKDVDIAVGNIVGSNIFNIFWVLGISATIRPLPFSPSLMNDVLVTIGSTFLLFIFLFIGKRHVLERWQGLLFVLIYIGYIASLVIRG